MLQQLPPVYTAALFRPLHGELLGLLRTLSTADWTRPTVARGWKVRDVVAHLLDGDLRKLAACRDDYLLPLTDPIENARDLARLINGLNASGVSYAARLSPRLLADLLGVTGSWVSDLVETLDPHDRACFAVSWAGEVMSENWMDIGREYTERWHHQAQIRAAVGVPRLLDPRWLDPLLDLSVRALPVAYARLTSPDETTVSLLVRGRPTSAWTVVRQERSWRVFRGAPERSHASVVLDADDAWRLFYNALPPGAVESLEVHGDRHLVEPMLSARSVIL